MIWSLQGAFGFCWAAPRRHHPWFSRSSADDSFSRRQVGEGGDEGKGRALTLHPLPRSAGEGVPDGNKVVEQALRYKGTRYQYGGTTHRGLDCSGLVSRVWNDLKMKKIPRASSALYNSGKPVHLAELRPGDLVFFKNTYKSGISHVGVYAGNNKFVHAANRRKGVTITRLSDPYYQLHYAGARRLY